MRASVGAQLALFSAGMFFGGAFDHVVLALMGSELTPYGIRSGVIGNWGFAVFDLAVAAGLYWLWRQLTKPARGR
jgi:hypothetical protein